MNACRRYVPPAGQEAYQAAQGPQGARQEGRRLGRRRDVRSRGGLGQGERDPQEGERSREEGKRGREGPRQGREGQGEEVEEVDGFGGEVGGVDASGGGCRAPTTRVVASVAYSSFSPPARIPCDKP